MPSIEDFVTIRSFEGVTTSKGEPVPHAKNTMVTLPTVTVERDGKKFHSAEPQLVVAVVRPSSYHPNRLKVSFGAKLGRPIAPGQPRPRVEFPIDGKGATEIRLEMN